MPPRPFRLQPNGWTIYFRNTSEEREREREREREGERGRSSQDVVVVGNGSHATRRDKARASASESPRGRSSAIVQSGAAAVAAVVAGQRPRASGTELQRRWRRPAAGAAGGSSLYECVRVMMIESELNGWHGCEYS